MTYYDQFSTLNELRMNLNSVFDVGTTNKREVEKFLTSKQQAYEVFEYASSRNTSTKHLINSTQDYDSIIQFSVRLKRKYWFIFSTVFIWIVRFHFNNDNLVEIVTLNVEDGSP
ncbi:MAG: hypothetical protein ACFE0Q_09160 [Anaerolineae bacterium]